MSTATPKPCVMIVDDDVRVLKSLEIVLRGKYTVRTYSRAQDAVSCFASPAPHGFSTIIMDVKMPEMDGFAAFREIRKHDAKIPIIFNSAYQDTQHPDAVKYEFGPFAYVSKGGDVKDFCALVERAVRSSSGQPTKA